MNERKAWQYPNRTRVGITRQEDVMNKDQVKGRIQEVKGKTKKVTGKIIGNKSMEVEGNVDETLGKVRRGYGDLKDDLEDEVKQDK